jgi:hypothetical protein
MSILQLFLCNMFVVTWKSGIVVKRIWISGTSISNRNFRERDEQHAFDRDKKKCCFEIDNDDMDFDDDVTSSPRREIDNCIWCQKNYHRELLCDGCNSSFRPCCEGYSREPIGDRIYPLTGAQITLLSFCSICLGEKGCTL